MFIKKKSYIQIVKSVMDDITEQLVINQEDLTEDCGVNKSIEEDQRQQIFTNNSLEITLPVLSSNVNKTDMEIGTHIDIDGEITNKDDIKTSLSTIKQESSCSDEHDDVISSSVSFYITKHFLMTLQ